MAKPKEVVIEVEQKEVVPLLIQKAFSLERVKGGWVYVEITFQGIEILSVERTEPDLKAVAIERFKIASFKYWNSIG